VNTGLIISGIGHVSLIGWVLFGGAFQSEPLPFEVTEVSMISSDAFEALLTTGPQPDTVTEVVLPAAPTVDLDPVATSQPDQTIATDAPQVSPEPVSETVPAELPSPVPPVPEGIDTAPVALQPQDFATLVPDVGARPIPRPSERVAPLAVAPPPPEALPDPVERDQVTQQDEAETPAQEQEATAPQEAATEIVTEAEEPSGALRSSLRPPSRRPAPPTRTVGTPDTPAAAATQAVVNDALREALGGTAPDVPLGPPLSAGEKDALRVAVSVCWNVGSLSSEALLTTVTVGFDMSRKGRPVVSTMRMISSSGGSAAGAKQAYETARRAIIRCTGQNGYQLPIEKYDQWKQIEITFNPERMRIK
jgi:hypothetical protein